MPACNNDQRRREPKPRFALVLEASAARDEADQLRRLRAVLKRLLRTYGLRCVEVRPAAATTAQTASRDDARSARTAVEALGEASPIDESDSLPER